MRYDLRDLLPVGSDVLYGRAPDRSRNTAETLDSSKVAFDAALNQRVPLFPGSCPNDSLVPIIDPFGAHHANLQHQPRETLISNENVRSAAQHEQWQVFTVREVEGFKYVRFGRSIDEITGRAANSECSQRRQRHVFLNSCFHVR